MRIMKIKRVIALVALLAVAGLTGLGYANHSPSPESIAFAQQTNNPGQWVGALTVRVPIRNN